MASGHPRKGSQGTVMANDEDVMQRLREGSAPEAIEPVAGDYFIVSGGDCT